VSELPPTQARVEWSAFRECKPRIDRDESLQRFTMVFPQHCGSDLTAFDRNGRRPRADRGSALQSQFRRSAAFATRKFSFSRRALRALRDRIASIAQSFVERHLAHPVTGNVPWSHKRAACFSVASHRHRPARFEASRAAEDGEFDQHRHRRRRKSGLSQTASPIAWDGQILVPLELSARQRIACQHRDASPAGPTGHPHRDAHASSGKTLRDFAALDRVDANESDQSREPREHLMKQDRLRKERQRVAILAGSGAGSAA